MSPNHIIDAGSGRQIPTIGRRAARRTGGSAVVAAGRDTRVPADAPASHAYTLVTALGPGVVGAVSRVGNYLVVIVSDRVPAGRVGAGCWAEVADGPGRDLDVLLDISHAIGSGYANRDRVSGMAPAWSGPARARRRARAVTTRAARARGRRGWR